MQNTLAKAQIMFSWINFSRMENKFWSSYGDLDKEKLIGIMIEESSQYTELCVEKDIHI